MRRPAALAARVAALAGVALAAASLVAIGLTHAQADRRGEDEITYVDLRPAALGPGDSITQPVRVQAGGLSRVGLLYSFPGPGAPPLRVTVRSDGRVLADRVLALRPTPPAGSPRTWWEQSFPNSVARMLEVPVRGRAGRVVTVTAAVPAGGSPVILYWSPTPPGAPASAGDPTRRYAVRTEYGPVRPAALRAGTLVARMSEVGAPWLPAPALWALAALVALLVGGLAWRMAGAGPPGADPAQ